jgi:hypothetical protein
MFLAPCPFPRCRVECEMHAPAHLHKGVTYTVHEILTFITRLIRVCLQSLHHRFVDWTKLSNTALILGTLTDLSRNKSELVAENALLRKPLIILRRHMKRPEYTKMDRMLLMLLARMVRAWKQALFIVQPETLLRWHRQGFRLFWKYKSRAAARKSKITAEIVALIKEMARDNRLCGAERIRGELLKLGIRVCLPHHSEIYATGPHNSTTWADLEDLLTHSCRADLGLRRASLSRISSSTRCSPSSLSNCTRAK